MPGQTPEYEIFYPTADDPPNMGQQIAETALDIDLAMVGIPADMGPALANSVEWEDVAWTPNIQGMNLGNAIIESSARRLAGGGIVWLSLAITAPAAAPAVNLIANSNLTVSIPLPAAGPAFDLGYFMTGGGFTQVEAGLSGVNPPVFYIHSIPINSSPRYLYATYPATVISANNWAPNSSLRVQLMYRTPTDALDLV